MKLTIPFYLFASMLCCLIGFQVSAQCPTSQFSVQSSVCRNEALQFSNTSSGTGLTYDWDFCPGHFRDPGIELVDSTFSLSSPEGLDVLVEGNDRVAFVTSKGNQKIFRFVFGNGFDQQPTLVEDLTSLSPILNQPSGIKLIKQNGIWYALIICYGSNNLIRVEFGSTLTSAVVSSAIIADNSVTQFDGPRGIDMVRDSSGNIHALVTNMFSSTLSVIEFGNDILSTPVISAPQAMTGGLFPLGVKIMKSCDNWYAFVPNYSSNNILRMEFGNNFSSTASNFTSITSISNASGFDMLNDSSEWRFVSSSYNSNIYKYSLGASITSSSATQLGMDHFAGDIPRTIKLVRDNGKYLCFVVYESTNNFKVINYTGSCSASASASILAQPVGISYDQGGNHAVSLLVQDSYGNQNSSTQVVSVSGLPIAGFTSSNHCEGDTVNFVDLSSLSSGQGNWNWDFGDGQTSTLQNPQHLYALPGTYNVSLSVESGTCTDVISQSIVIDPKPVAAYNSTPGCSNTLTIFTDASSVASGNIVSWNWDFGNGDNATSQNPQYSFPTGGNFPVALTVTTNAGCSSSISQFLQVNSRPIADFLEGNTCIGQPVSFTNLTQANGSSISSYAWDLGDGNLDTASNPLHAYANVVSTYTVQLIVSANNGCVDTITRTIKINNIPTANFSIPTLLCQGNEIQFTDLSIVSGDTISKWSWDFGDGAVDTIGSPLHAYSNPGNYTATLIAYSPSNCPSAPIQQSFLIKESPVASYTFNNTCEGSLITFNNTSTAANGTTISSQTWIFNNLDSSSFSTAYYTFNSAGTYPVALVVTASDGCTDIELNSLNINQKPISNFSTTLGCSGQNVQFTNLSTCDSLSSISQYAWNFGDFNHPGTNTSSLTNPVHQYDTAMSFTASLITVTTFGCSDTLFKTVQVFRSAPVQFTYSPTCFGNLMEFFNPGSSLDSAYHWNFGDGQFSALKEPAHYYANPGNYLTSLQVTTPQGCVSTATKYAVVSPIPVAEFVTSPACVNGLYTFQNQSTVSNGSLIGYDWHILEDTADFSGINPEYTFTDTGNYHVTLTVTSDIGCTKSMSHVIDVHSLPDANFSFDPQFGNPPLDVQVTDYSIGGITYQWNFGTDTTITTLHEPTFTYTDTGLFMITQIVTSQFGCIDTATKNIYVIKPILDLAVTGDSSYTQGDYFYVVARIANLGTREITSFDMEARLENGSTIKEHSTNLLPNGPGGMQNYNFTAAFQIDPEKSVDYYCIKATSPNGESDLLPGNNELCFNRTSKIIVVAPHPNPFENELNIRLILPASGSLIVDLFDVAGKTVSTLYSGKATEGLHDLNSNFSNLPDGLYALRIRFRDEDTIQKIVKYSASH